MDPLIVTVAPTGSVPTREMNPYLPVTPDEIADTALRCREAGASIVHVHARDSAGRPTLDEKVFAEICHKIAASSDLIVQVSTGGRAGTDVSARAAAVRLLQPEMASLTTGSTNFPDRVYANPFDVIEHLAGVMLAAGTKPEIEVFEPGMIANALLLVDKGLLAPPLHFDLVLGSRGSLAASPRNLLFLAESVPRGSTWTVAGIGRAQLPMAALGIVLGGHVRVGLEDNLLYRKRQPARNEELVARVARLAEELERPVATPDQARAILGLRPRS